MASDWIKMRMALQTHPKIVRILSATSSDKFRVIGGLHAVWCVFDTHSTDGVLNGYTPEALDHVIGWSGFSRAMIDVGWLLLTPESLVMPEFGEHNGESAKRRAENTKQKRVSRMSAKRPQNVHEFIGQNEDKMRTREEKRRINKPPISPCADAQGFDDFWNTYPRKVGKQSALKAWIKHKPDLQVVLAALAWQTKLPEWTKDGGSFIPHAATYLNGARWEDEFQGNSKPVTILKNPDGTIDIDAWNNWAPGAAA